MRLPVFLLTILFVLPVFLSCTGQQQPSSVKDVSTFQFNDSSLPWLKAGFYLITTSDSVKTVPRKMYDISAEPYTGREQFYDLSTTDVVLFENVDSIYREKSKSEYKGFFNILLKLNPTGQQQMADLSAKTRFLTEEEKYDGLLIGTVINNTLIQVTHVHQKIDTNLVSIAGGSFYEATVNDLIQYLEKGRREN